MEAKPILFTGENVRAILDGRKSQTRRVIKPQPEFDEPNSWSPSGYLTFNPDSDRWQRIALDYVNSWAAGEHSSCPYGQPGGLLWVRETHAICQTVDHVRWPGGRAFDEVSDGFAMYRADGHDTIQDVKDHIKMMSDGVPEKVLVKGDRWRPSIHMPRWASRITLRVRRVRVERVQDISEEDAIAEGVEIRLSTRLLRLRKFAFLWDSINAKRGFGWDVNPWVWVVEFERVAG